MSSAAPIGFFDSGFGGISVLAEAVRLFPNESYIFFGDNLNAPYGERPADEVMRLTRRGAERLIEMGCKALVIACNTATGVAVEALRGELKLPIIGMEPALKPASMLPGEGLVLVMATPVTVSQRKFKRLMELYGRSAVPLPCHGLVERVEAGETSGESIRARLDEILSPYRDMDIKAIVLGCTHFVFLKPAILSLLPGARLVDGNEGTVRQLGRRLSALGLESGGGRPGGIRLISSRPGTEALMRHMLSLAQEI